MRVIALLLLAAVPGVAGETQTVIYDFAVKPEESRRLAYQQANALNLAARRTPVPPVKGKVIQRLKPSRYMVTGEDGTAFLVDLVPGRGELAAGAALTCSLEYVGVYKYNSVEGVQRQVKHFREMTEAERAGRRWKTYPEFCQWLQLGNTCELRKSEPTTCLRCSGTGTAQAAAGGPANRCSHCGGSGRDMVTTLYHLVWTTQSRPASPVAPTAGLGPKTATGRE